MMPSQKLRGWRRHHRITGKSQNESRASFTVEVEEFPNGCWTIELQEVIPGKRIQAFYIAIRAFGEKPEFFRWYIGGKFPPGWGRCRFGSIRNTYYSNSLYFHCFFEDFGGREG